MPISDLLKSVPMFAGLSDRELAVLEAMLDVEDVPAGQMIIKHDEIGRSLYIISEGSVSITRTMPDGNKVELAVVQQGEVLGELSTLDAGPRSADATAIEDCQLFVLAPRQVPPVRPDRTSGGSDAVGDTTSHAEPTTSQN
jgi:CRP/FNR family cyclic AMP-dependent transcriptional regulator